MFSTSVVMSRWHYNWVAPNTSIFSYWDLSHDQYVTETNNILQTVWRHISIRKLANLRILIQEMLTSVHKLIFLHHNCQKDALRCWIRRLLLLYVGHCNAESFWKFRHNPNVSTLLIRSFTASGPIFVVVYPHRLECDKLRVYLISPQIKKVHEIL